MGSNPVRVMWEGLWVRILSDSYGKVVGSDLVRFTWECRGFESPKIHVERSLVRIPSESHKFRQP